MLCTGLGFGAMSCPGRIGKISFDGGIGAGIGIGVGISVGRGFA